MGRCKAVTINKMAKRIYRNRKDNIIKPDMIAAILEMYTDECEKALLNGERVQLGGIGTIIPEVRTHRNCFLPLCNNEQHENTPYTRIKISRLEAFRRKMDRTLLENIENGIYGLNELLYDAQQITNLKSCGYIPEDENTEGKTET